MKLDSGMYCTVCSPCEKLGEAGFRYQPRDVEVCTILCAHRVRSWVKLDSGMYCTVCSPCEKLGEAGFRYVLYCVLTV